MQTKALLAVISLIFFVTGIVCVVIQSRKKQPGRRLVLVTLFLILSILPLNLCPADEEDYSLPFAFLPRTLQAFSVDVDYDKVFEYGLEESGRTLDLLFRIYETILYSLAPIVGGAVIYDVLAGISPNLRLLLVRRRRLYVFSELNDRSLYLAESIDRDKRHGRKPVLVFADCSAEGVDGEGAALLARARGLRAICLFGRLNDCVGLARARECVFFLMARDEGEGFDDFRNLSLLRAMLDSETSVWSRARGCHLFCFSNRASAVENMRATKLAYDRGPGRDRGEVALHVVRDYAQAANALMSAHPLFEALADKPDGAPMRVLLIGDNDFSREMFKTVFWCGQMLDHPLQLAVACEGEPGAEDPTAFERWLNAECPELLESCSEGSDCLRATLEGDHNPPYAALCFASVSPDVLYGESLLEEVRPFQYGSATPMALGDFDYIIVMTGSDAGNIRLAESLWRQLARKRLEGSGIGKKIIAVAVRDDQLSQVTGLRYAMLKEETDAADIVTFATEESRYRWENVFDAGIYARNGAQRRSVEEALHSLPGMDVTRDRIYDEWSMEARRLHLKTRMFCALRRRPAPAQMAQDALKDKVDYCETLDRDPGLTDRLSWLEHRRWNAFLRTQGFRRPPRLTEKLRDLAAGRCEGEDIGALSPYAYKNVPARMHPNLLESVRGGRSNPPDMLDLDSDMRMLVDKKQGKNPTDLKIYDRPDGQYGPSMSRAEVCACLSDLDLTATGEALEAAWQRLEQRYHEALADCEFPDNPNRYMAGQILKLRSRR